MGPWVLVSGEGCGVIHGDTCFLFISRMLRGEHFHFDFLIFVGVKRLSFVGDFL